MFFAFLSSLFFCLPEDLKRKCRTEEEEDLTEVEEAGVEDLTEAEAEDSTEVEAEVEDLDAAVAEVDLTDSKTTALLIMLLVRCLIGDTGGRDVYQWQ